MHKSMLLLLYAALSASFSYNCENAAIKDIVDAMALTNPAQYSYDELVWCHDYFQPLELNDQVDVLLFLTLKVKALETDAYSPLRKKAFDWALQRNPLATYEQFFDEYRNTHQLSALALTALAAHDEIIARIEQTHKEPVQFRLDFTRRTLQCAHEILQKKIVYLYTLLKPIEASVGEASR
jgi:hypothetical protein